MAHIRGGHGGVQDRTIYEDSVFAKMLLDSGKLDQRDYNTCKGRSEFF